MVYLMFAAGLVGLFVGGEFLIRGSVAVAQRLMVPPLVIGLTIVGFGTSSPELLVSVQAALAGSPAIAIGNVVGSNIAN
ncbi:MAG: sodium:calcium antiporter, partial [Rhodobacteraceae bacterium]|nr:sodium:calcium antiporter [Paracoccaceae bacterium]